MEEPEERDFDFQGHYVCLDGEGDPYSPDPNATYEFPPAHQAHCPPSADPLTIWGCRGGHFYPEIGVYEYPIWANAGWVLFEFYQYDEYNELHKLGEGYFYWDPDRPYWSLHRAATSTFLVPDIVDIPYPE